ncbi:hypothetical protein CKO28_03440 [Rhodovibrio sodomensis]|uniref:Pentapeptide repeat-containing protein n=2 Tax=Rhodovibrio sodomensis TaxID=1088 RepID=A0ABS1DAW8_9PROT|nr:hypothetical protein [Rhodovibrio sodomensis]
MTRTCRMPLLIAALLVAWTSTGHAFKADDAAKLKKTNRCENCDLAGILMHGADLSGAVMTGSNLTAASFDEANLTNADLRQADLGGVDFGQANLTNAELQNSNLSGAFLRRTNLTGANLTGADMDTAMVADVIFCHTTMPSGRIRRPNCGGS